MLVSLVFYHTSSKWIVKSKDLIDRPDHNLDNLGDLMKIDWAFYWTDSLWAELAHKDSDGLKLQLLMGAHNVERRYRAQPFSSIQPSPSTCYTLFLRSMFQRLEDYTSNTLASYYGSKQRGHCDRRHLGRVKASSWNDCIPTKKNTRTRTKKQ